MIGIDLNKPIFFSHASLRYFTKNEHHIERFCKEYVLLLVFDGILRFSEDGTEYEIFPEQYHIQKKNSYQTGRYASDSPKYFYVHFDASTSENKTALPMYGNFRYANLKQNIEKLDSLCHGNADYVEKTALFYNILTEINKKENQSGTADEIASFMQEKIQSKITIEMISQKFNFSKNHIINIFKKNFGMTPIQYINMLRIKRAEYLLEVTSKPTSEIAFESGFNDYTHFYKQFFQKNLMSPSQWRNRKHSNPTDAELL